MTPSLVRVEAIATVEAVDPPVQAALLDRRAQVDPVAPVPAHLIRVWDPAADRVLSPALGQALGRVLVLALTRAV